MFGQYGKLWLVLCCTCFALQATHAFLKMPKFEELFEKKEALEAKKEAEWAKFVSFFEEKKQAELAKKLDFWNLFAEKAEKKDEDSKEDYKVKSYKKKPKPEKQPCQKYVEKVEESVEESYGSKTYEYVKKPKVVIKEKPKYHKRVYENDSSEKSAEESYESKPKCGYEKKPKEVIKEKPKYHKSAYENDSAEESVEQGYERKPKYGYEAKTKVIIKQKPKYQKRIYDNDSEEDEDVSSIEAYGKKRVKYSEDDKELVYKASDKPLYKSPVIETLPCHVGDDNDGCGKFFT